MKSVKKFKAEAFDIMQYFYGTVHDPLIHCLIRLSGHVNMAALKRAVSLTEASIPLIGCCFDIKSGHPYWKYGGFTVDDIVHLIENGNSSNEKIGDLLASTIDIFNEPQLKIFIVREERSDTLCIVMNHMVCDGTGFKEYLYLLCSLYIKCKNNPEEIPVPKPFSRSTSQLFENFGLLEKLKIYFLKYDLSKLKEQVTFSFHGDKDNPLFITRQISKEEFDSLKGFAKVKGVSVNDLFLTAYARVLHRKAGNERSIIPCPVDLRKYLSPDKRQCICNLTTNFICDVVINKDDLFEDTLIKVSNQMKLQKSSLNCLKSVIMLEIAFHIIPFRIMQKVFSKLFTIPVISFTNLGLIDKKLLFFDDTAIDDVYLTGAVKYVPYFQIAISTYDDCCTLSSNMYGSPDDKISIENFLEDIKEELSLCM